MSEYRGSIEIARPPQQVWNVVSDLASTPEWRTTVSTVEPPTVLEVGASFGATTKVLGRSWRWTLVIDEFDPPTTLTYSVVEGITDITVTYRLDPVADGTRFSLMASSRPTRWWEKLLEPIAARSLRRQSDGHLANLQRILERAEPLTG